MDVVKSNFDTVRPQIEEDIEQCCFAAIDCEFTGLNLPESIHPLDTVAERYAKLRAGLPEYLVVQFGLSLWTYDVDAEVYQVKTYNIYTFPPGSQLFRIQASCLKFLVDHKFDLNMCVREGLPYMHPKEYEYERGEMRVKQRIELSEILSSSSDKELSDILDGSLTLADLVSKPRPENLIASTDQHAAGYILNVWDIITRWFDRTNKQDELILPACGEYIRIGVYRHLERVMFKEKFRMESLRDSSSDNRGIRKIKLIRTDSSPLQRLLESQAKERAELDGHLGVTWIIKKLSQTRKPIVGHNNMRDLLFIISQFLAPLPESFDEFKIMSREIFPYVFDTKYMCNQLKINSKSSRLLDLFNSLSANKKLFPLPNIKSDADHSYKGSACEHEAGYDAWITGKIFAALSQHIAPSRSSRDFVKIDVSHEAFAPYRNKLHFAPSIDISVMDLEGHQTSNTRTSDVFIIEWKESENHTKAREFLASFGGTKRQSYGERLIAFVPSNPEQCLRVLRSQTPSSLPCKLYRWTGAKRNRKQRLRSRQKATRSDSSEDAPTPETTTTTPTTTSSLSNHKINVAPLQRSPSRSPEVDCPKKPKLDGQTDLFPEAQQW